MTDTGQTAKGKSTFKRMVNYKWIIHHLPFFLFLALLAILYIANGHWADKTIRNINSTARQVKNMEYEYKTLKSLEMFRSRESQIIKAAQPLGLNPATEQPIGITLVKENGENP